MLGWIKYSLLGLLALFVGGFLIFGVNFDSYLRTTARTLRNSVTDSVPLEFELRRARDLIETILPDLQSQVRNIAQEEVEIAALKSDIASSQSRLESEQSVLSNLRDDLRVQQVSYSVGARDLSRQQLTEQLHQRFERYKQGELALKSKQRLLEKRHESLAAALSMLEKMRHRKIELEHKVESLAAEHRLLQASSTEAGLKIDGGQLSDADQLLGQIEKRLAVAQRVLAHELDAYALPIVDDLVSEVHVLTEFDQHFEVESVRANRDELLVNVEVAPRSATVSK